MDVRKGIETVAKVNISCSGGILADWPNPEPSSFTRQDLKHWETATRKNVRFAENLSKRQVSKLSVVGKISVSPKMAGSKTPRSLASLVRRDKLVHFIQFHPKSPTYPHNQTGTRNQETLGFGCRIAFRDRCSKGTQAPGMRLEFAILLYGSWACVFQGEI